MAGSFKNYTEDKVLDHVVGKTAFTMPSTWLALFTVAPTDSTDGTEVTGGSYARKATVGADWADASGGAITNANALTFVTATGDWGEIVAAALCDAATAGNQLVWGDLAVMKHPTSGDTFNLAAGEIDFTLS